MSLSSRVASFAAMTLALFGIVQSAPGLAAELDRQTVAAIATATLPTPVVVAAAPSDDGDAQPAPAIRPATFDSLDEAVAAQDLNSRADSDALRCLATAIYFESKGEPVSGQLAVAQVILNRAKSGRFPADACGVVRQRGQFSFVRGGALPDIDEGRAQYRTALAVAKVAMADAWKGPAEGALFFHARRVVPNGRFVRVAAVGNHVFYR